MSTIYGYIRVSTTAQVDSGLSLQAQREQVSEYIAKIASKQLVAGRIYSEQGVSASKRQFRVRPQGKLLDRKLRDGDHIVIAKLDRGFRSTTDCLQTLKHWQRRNITVHLLDLRVDTSTPMGQLLIGILAVIAEWESSRRGERIRDALHERRKTAPGKALTGIRVLGYRVAEDGTLLPHKQERAAGQMASKLRAEGLSWAAIVEQLRQKKYRRPASPRGNKSQRQDKDYTIKMVQALVRRHRDGWPMYPLAKISEEIET